ncbi:toprim domain-containing protein [Endozoicomonas sp. SM1973]|uniref:Toprim domain-containing protein n=1 Tax=Spartinivicinus marinus TaxID=2994442 RepID=A0A853I9B6_9GAMM|nr:DUF5906 domain-containing protein [Spartinivicinus marinus]NYZ69469.1 toprim domain-containing protein [Spartinivicinus marinus]
MSKFLEKDTIKNLATGQWLSIFLQLAPTSFAEAISKKNIHVACPIHGGQDGFRFHDDVETTGGGVCNTCGHFTDGFALLSWANGWSFRESLIQVDNFLSQHTPYQLPKEREGGKPSQVPAQAPEPIKVKVPKKNEQLINRLLKEAKEDPNEAVKAYLTGRGLSELVDKLPACLKSHEKLGYYSNNKKLCESPALVGEVTKDGKRVGLQRHYLTSEGAKLELYDEDEGKQLPSKSMIGSFKGALSGGAVQFDQPVKVLHVGEGIETMLAVWHSVGEPAWACCTAPLLRALDVPEGLEKVIIWVDKDYNKAGIKAARVLGQKLHGRGITTYYLEPNIEIPANKDGVDWLDEYNQRGKSALKNAYNEALDPTNAIDEIDLYPDAAIKRAVAEINKTFVHVVHEGKNYVVREASNALGQKHFEMIKLQEFVNLPTLKKPVLVGWKTNGEPKYKKPGSVWLDSEDAICAPEGMTFKPVANKWIGPKLNMYFGLGVEPVKCTAKNIAPYLQHLRDNICSGNNTHFNYLLDWMAHLVQQPEEKPGVAIVLQGGQGTGKGTMVKPVGEIIGHHFFYAHNPETISGRFNSALENKMMIFADEAFFASKKATDTLKSMITEPIQTIERKGIDPIMTPSYCRIIMASNHTNIVHAEEDERRYFVLQVGEARKGDHDYWTKYNRWEQSQPLAGMLLYYLKNRDISQFNPRIVPASDALTEQKLHSAEPPMRFLFEALNNACFVLNEAWPVRLLASEMTRHFKEYLERENLKLHGEPSRILGKKLSKLGFNKTRSGGQPYYYELPTLEKAREAFEEVIKGEVDWDT